MAFSFCVGINSSECIRFYSTGMRRATDFSSGIRFFLLQLKPVAQPNFTRPVADRARHKCMSPRELSIFYYSLVSTETGRAIQAATLQDTMLSVQASTCVYSISVPVVVFLFCVGLRQELWQDVMIY